MKEIKFVIQDIWENKLTFIWNTIQIFVVGLVLIIVFDNVISYENMKSKIDELSAQKNVYMFRDMTNDDKYEDVLNNESKEKKAIELYKDFLAKVKKVDCFSLDFFSVFGCSDETRIQLVKKLPRLKEPTEDLNMISISDNVLDLFHLKCEGDIKQFGRMSGGAEGILVGDSFKDILEIGDCIESISEEKYKVVGYVKQGDYVIAPDAKRDPIYLDEYIIRKSKENSEDIISVLRELDSTYYIMDDETLLNEFANDFRNNDLLEMRTINYTYQMQAISDDLIERNILFGSVAVLVLIFCVVSMSGNILNMFSKYRREYAIEMMCGSTKKAIVLRYLIYVMLMEVVAILIVGICMGINISFGIAIGIETIYLLFVLIIPIICLRKENIQSLLKKSYE